MGSNHVCREAEGLQSSAVASAALNPKMVPRERFELPASGFVIQ
jgi:hypothetical protein